MLHRVKLLLALAAGSAHLGHPGSLLWMTVMTEAQCQLSFWIVEVKKAKHICSLLVGPFTLNASVVCVSPQRCPLLWIYLPTYCSPSPLWRPPFLHFLLLLALSLHFGVQASVIFISACIFHSCSELKQKKRWNTNDGCLLTVNSRKYKRLD